MPEKENNNNTTEIKGNAEDSIIVSGDQSVIHIHKPPDEKDIKSKISYLNIFLILLFVGIVSASAIYFLYPQKNTTTPPTQPPPKLPKFIIENPILRSDAALIIKAGNEAANRKELLTVEFDGFAFAEKGIPAKDNADNGRQRWHFSLTDQQALPDMLKDGEHKIRAGFTGEDLGDVHKIAFFTKAPVTKIQISSSPDNADAKEIKVKAASELQIPENKLTVEMVFFHEGEEQTINVPVRQSLDPKTGIICYEFQTKIQGFKEFSDKDPRRAEPFFGLKVTDQAGNSYYQEQSYAQYMAPGTNRFGVNDLASITVEKVPDAVSKQFIHLVRLTPQPKRVDQLSDGMPPIKLEKVELKTDNSRYLEWKSRVKDVKGLTLVFRDEQQIGVSTTNSYIDNEKLAKDIADYRVEQEGKDGTRYLSNKETFKKPVEVLLTVKSNVKEDSVYIDGEKRGATPLNYKIMTGKHSVRVEKPGYTTFEQEIDLQKDQTVTAKLEPAASLRVETEPAGATVFMNGKKSGIAPVTLKGLKPGNIQIKAELAGYKAREQAYLVKPENPEPIKLVMERLPEIRYSLTVKPEPSDAEVRIVNPQTDYQPGLRLKPGTYQISVSRESFKAKNSSVEIKNQDVVLTVSLEKEKVPETPVKEEEKPAPKPKNLRSTPITASDEDCKSKFKLDENLRPLEYVKNDFKDNGNGTITDHTTGLIWQKSGSPNYIYLKDVPAYIEKLNSDKFAGYSDWRLPTVDELKSLLTPKEMNGDLYINPLFDKMQRWCWTSDKRSSGGAWRVNFNYGYVSWNDGNNDYVRAVRSRQ